MLVFFFIFNGLESDSQSACCGSDGYPALQPVRATITTQPGRQFVTLADTSGTAALASWQKWPPLMKLLLCCWKCNTHYPVSVSPRRR